MKNKLIDLNDHLFAQLERLSDETISREKLDIETNRAKSMAMIAKEIIAGGRLALDAQTALGNGEIEKIPETLQLNNESIPSIRHQ